MHTATEKTSNSRLHAVADDIFGPVRASHGTFERKLLLTRSAFAYGGLIATLVQIVVWLAIAVTTAHLDTPWWLWTALPAAAAVGLLTLARRWAATAETRTADTRRGEAWSAKAPFAAASSVEAREEGR